MPARYINMFGIVHVRVRVRGSLKSSLQHQTTIKARLTDCVNIFLVKHSLHVIVPRTLGRVLSRLY